MATKAVDKQSALDSQPNALSTVGFRPIMPAPAVSSGSSQGTIVPTDLSTQSGRHQVSSACLQCRKRKVKCSGSRPTCGRCSAKEIVCEWDTEPDTSRTASIRKRKEELERENKDLHNFLGLLYLRPEEEAVEILKRFRRSGDALQTLDFVRSADLLLQRVHVETSPREPILIRSDGVDRSTGDLKVPAKPWTDLANDGVVSELITEFFKWDEPFLLAFVDQEGFLEDMRKCSPETARYCSPLLVNAICALRSQTSKLAKAFGRASGRDMRLGFFDEARRQLNSECGRMSLATAEALFILHLTAAALGMDRATQMYHLAACDMVQRLEAPAHADTEEGRREQQIYSKGLWGMYCFESMFAFLYLRPSLLPMPSVPRSFVNQSCRNLPGSPRLMTENNLVLNAACDLSIIFNKTMEYNKEMDIDNLGGKQDVYKRIALFRELQTWRESIPQETEEGRPFDYTVFYLRAYEDQVILSIFRPLEPGIRLLHDGYVADLLMRYCGRSIDGIEELERVVSSEDCSSMVLIPLFNTAVTLAGLLHHSKSHEIFARTCRLLQERMHNLPLAGFLLQGLKAMAAENGDRIPEVAKRWFRGLQHGEATLKDVPISLMLPAGNLRGPGDGGVQLGNLLWYYQVGTGYPCEKSTATAIPSSAD